MTRIRLQKQGKWYKPLDEETKQIFMLLFKGISIRTEQVLGLKELGFKIEYIEPTLKHHEQINSYYGNHI